jgi:carbon monoxide dehydrogenase subunit G
MAKGAARVKLTETSVDQTILEYEARVDVGGKIAQLGARLLDSTATKLTRKFFDDFNEIVSKDFNSAA